MKVGKLIQKLQKMDPEMDVIVDYDENGWYNLEGVELRALQEDDGEAVNLKTSNES